MLVLSTSKCKPIASTAALYIYGIQLYPKITSFLSLGRVQSPNWAYLCVHVAFSVFFYVGIHFAEAITINEVVWLYRKPM
jgi:hypothetical protein